MAIKIKLKEIIKLNINSENILVTHSPSVVSDEETPLTAVKVQKILVCGIASVLKLMVNQILVYQPVIQSFTRNFKNDLKDDE